MSRNSPAMIEAPYNGAQHKLFKRSRSRAPADLADFDDELPADFMGGFMDAGIVTRRSSDSMPGLKGADLGVLDGIIERHGIARMLKSMRELCDSRAHAEATDMDATLADLNDSDKWKHLGDVIEAALLDARMK